MNPRVAFCLALAFLFYGGHAVSVTFKNKCPYTVWPGTLTGDNMPQLSKTGFKLASKASTSVDVPCPWSGIFWARTGCSTASGKFACKTADCASGRVQCNGAGASQPATLIVLKVAPNGGQDYYGVSNVDGFNVPMSIAPLGGTGKCQPSSCPKNINKVCPAKLQVKKGNDVVACKSTCLATGEPQYCCTGEFNSPQKCKRSQSAKIFKQQCPQAYSYAYDDKGSLFTCSSPPTYAITFCP